MWEYNPGTVAPVAIIGIAGVGGSHFIIICSRDFAVSFTVSQSLHIIRCVCIIVGIVSINFSFLASSFWSTISPNVFMRSIHSSTSIVLGLNDRMFHDCNCSLFVFPHGLYLCKNIVFIVVRSLNFHLFVWNQTNAVLSIICSKRSMPSFTGSVK